MTPHSVLPGIDPDAMRLLLHSTYPDCGVSGTPLAFSAANRRSDLVRPYPDLAEVCDRLGFRSGETIEQWCSEPWWALLELARAAHPPPTPTALPAGATLAVLVTDIVNTHHRNSRNELRRLGIILAHACLRHAELRHLALPTAFIRFAQGMVEHLDHEESVVFPLCLAIQDANQRQVAGHPRMYAVSAAVEFMGEGHEVGGARLSDLLDRVAAAVAGAADPDFVLVAEGLAVLAQDLSVHERKEVGALAPIASLAAGVMRDRSEACGEHMRHAGYQA